MNERKFWRWFLGILFAIFLILTSVYYYEKYIVRVDIIYTNDIHGNIEVLPKIAYYTRKIKNKNLILIDCGDFIQGTPESDFFKGISMIETFNFTKYDFVQVGNHEFDFGEEHLVSLSKIAQFKFLGSNIVDEKSQIKPYITEFVIKNFDGIKIGLFGLITTRTKDMVLKENIKNVYFLDEIETAKNIVEKLKNSNVNIIFCVSHIGWSSEKKDVSYKQPISDIDLAKNVPEIKIIFGGHTHQKYKKRIGRTVLLQTGAHGQNFGHLTLWINKYYNNIWWLKNRFIKTNKIKKKNVEVEVLVNHYVQETSKVYDVEIGNLKVNLTRDRNIESTLGNFVADVIAENVRCDFAVTNSGGLRADLSSGTVTYRDIYMVCPFDNTIVYTKLSGKEIKEMFEYSAKSEYGILQVSRNISVIYDRNKNVEIKIDEKPIEEDKLYIVATNSFVGSGGDGYVWFTKSKIVDTKKLLREAIKEYLQKNLPVYGKVENRIVFQN